MFLQTTIRKLFTDHSEASALPAGCNSKIRPFPKYQSLDQQFVSPVVLLSIE